MADKPNAASPPRLLPGTPMVLGDGKEYVIAPLTLAQANKLSEQIRLLTVSVNPIFKAPPEERAALLDVIHAALSRNHPEISREALEDLVDLGNALPALTAAYGIGKVAAPAQSPAPAQGRAVQVPPPVAIQLAAPLTSISRAKGNA